MRQFVKTQKFKAISYTLVFALLLPFYSLLMARTAVAQAADREQWAVVPFSVSRPVKDVDLSKAGSSALNDELAKFVRNAELVPADTVDREIENLGFTPPVKDEGQLMRLGRSLGVASVVTGEIVNQQIRKVGEGQKVADVKVRVVVRDVASGMPINGSAILGSSSVRPADTSDQTLYEDALKSAAATAANEIASNTLPKATVLNTIGDTALINMGVRSGFQQGNKVIVIRGRQMVGTAEVTIVEPDSAYVRLVRSTRGIQPGDRIQAVVDAPGIDPNFKGGDPGIIKSRPKGNNSGLVSLIIVLGLVALLGTKSSGNAAVSQVTAQSFVDPDDRIGVLVKWRPDSFVKGSSQRLLWQIWRSDQPSAPVIVASDAALGDRPEVKDYGNAPASTFYTKASTGDPTCPTQSAGPTPTVTSPHQSGVPYVYSVELFYRIAALDNPYSTAGGGSTGTTAGGTGGLTGGSTGTTSGSTGGLTSGRGFADSTPGTLSSGGGFDAPRDLYSYYQITGSTTSSTTGTTTSGTTSGTTSSTTGTTAGSGSDCYFVSSRTAAKSTATPYARPLAQSPINNITVTTPQVFRFQVQRPTGASAIIEYVVQFASDQSFSGTVQSSKTFLDNSSSSNIATPEAIANVLTVFPGVAEIWWRVGVRNVGDKPGPVGSWIFSQPQRFKRPTNPPNP